MNKNILKSQLEKFIELLKNLYGVLNITQIREKRFVIEDKKTYCGKTIFLNIFQNLSLN